MRSWVIALFVVFGCIFPHTGCPTSFAERSSLERISDDFSVPHELAPYVEFWRLVFTKYNKYQILFHHRDRPEVIYSVLDFSDFKNLGESEVRRKQDQISKKEVDRIKFDLLHLRNGGSPDTSMQRRIVHIMSHIKSPDKYKAAVDQIRTQIGMRERFAESIIDAGKYLPSIERIFAEEGLPLEVARIPFVESSFNYNAVSSVGASGIWQFMRTTAKGYMRVDNYIDERRDPIASSRAAARYLKRAYQTLGSWPLAVTSYNFGVTGILRASNEVGSKRLIDLIRNYRSDSFGFASKNFYVSFLAALEVSKNYRSYFPGLVVADTIRFDELRLARSIGHKSLLSYSGLSEDEFSFVNPGLLAPVRTGRVPIPAGAAVKVAPGRGKSALSSLGGGELLSLSGEVVLAVGPGSSPSQGSTQIELAETKSLWNDVTSNRNRGSKSTPQGSISPSDSLQAMLSSKEGNSRALLQKETGPKRVQEGKNSSISDIEYSVKSGDSLWSIAAKHSMSLQTLQKANGWTSAKALRQGDKLVIPSKQIAPSSEIPSRPLIRQEAKKTLQPKQDQHYSVREGDSLFSIARNHGLTLIQLKALNPKASQNLQPGDKIVVR